MTQPLKNSTNLKMLSQKHYNSLESLASTLESKHAKNASNAVRRALKHFKTLEATALEVDKDLYQKSYVTLESQNETLQLIYRMCEEYQLSQDNKSNDLISNIKRLSKEFINAKY